MSRVLMLYAVASAFAFAFALAFASVGSLPFWFSCSVMATLMITGVGLLQSGALNITEDEQSWFNSFWVVSAFIFIIISSSSKEFYVRRCRNCSDGVLPAAVALLTWMECVRACVRACVCARV